MSPKSLPALDLIRFFETKAALVVAAVASLECLTTELTRLNAALAPYDRAAAAARVAAIEALVRRATIGEDNLLVSKFVTPSEPFVLCAVSRQPNGSVEVKTIELDRDALALSGAPRAGRPRPMNAMVAAVHALVTDRRPPATKAAVEAIESFAAQVGSAISRLSLVKARLDLQQSFLASASEPSQTTRPTSVRADSHLNCAEARDIAMEARRLLSARSLKIGNSNALENAALLKTSMA